LVQLSGLRLFKERFHPAWEPRYLAYRGRGTAVRGGRDDTARFREMAGAPPGERTDRVKRLLFFVLLVAPPLLAAPSSSTVEELKFLPGFGDVMIYRPRDLGSAHGVVLFVSGDGGWKLGVVDMARRIDDRAIVAGISMQAWQKRAEKNPAPAGTRRESSRWRHRRSRRSTGCRDTCGRSSRLLERRHRGLRRAGAQLRRRRSAAR